MKRSLAARRLASLALALIPALGVVVIPTANEAQAATGWDVTVSPPAMSAPTRIELSASTPTEFLPAWGILCAGQHYAVNLGEHEDAVITMAGNEPLPYPIWIVGGRNVRVSGLEMVLATQPGCGTGQLPNTGSSAKSIHPRIPGAMAIRLENYGTSFVEGVDIDLMGAEADCFVVRNPAKLTNAVARNQRNVVLQNTSCTGVEGLGQSAIGDGVHGDLLQNQGYDVMNSLTIENVSMRTSMEGLVLHGDGPTAGARNLTIRRFDYAADTRFDDDDAYEQFGVAFAAWADHWVLDQVYLDDPKGNNYGFVNDDRHGAIVSPYVTLNAGVHNGLPPSGAFAPRWKAGFGYVSPHDGLAGNALDPVAGAVKRLYKASFGRSPEPAGQLYWQQIVRSGVGLYSVAEVFQTSPEWAGRYGSTPTNEQIIDALYRNVLGRQGDAGGRSYWIGLLNAGHVNRAQVLLEFSESAENKTRTDTK